MIASTQVIFPIGARVSSRSSTIGVPSLARARVPSGNSCTSRMRVGSSMSGVRGSSCFDRLVPLAKVISRPVSSNVLSLDRLDTFSNGRSTGARDQNASCRLSRDFNSSSFTYRLSEMSEPFLSLVPDR